MTFSQGEEVFRQQHHIYKRLNNLLDAIITAASFILAYQARNNLATTAAYSYLGKLASFEYYATIFVLSCILWPILTNFNGLYSRHVSKFRNEANIIFKSSVEATVLLIAISYMFSLAEISRALIVTFAVTNMVLITLKAGAARLHAAYLRSRGIGVRNAILIGNRDVASKLPELLRSHAELGINVVGIVELNGSGQTAISDSYGSLSEIKDILHGKRIDQAIFLVDRKSLPDVEEAMFVCEEEGVEAWIAADFFALTLSRLEMEEIGDIPFLVFRTAPPLSWQMVVKYFLDIVFSALFIVLLSPLFLIVALAIKLDSGGKVFLAQERVGLRGNRFMLYKFRSMEGGLKVTAVGKFLRKSGIDELPQLINILKSEMSFVGPRPHIPSEVALYAHGWQRRRLSMRPGLTCYRQILHPGKVTFDQAMELDLKYIDNWSLAKDFAIVFRTVPLILSRFWRSDDME